MDGKQGPEVVPAAHGEAGFSRAGHGAGDLRRHGLRCRRRCGGRSPGLLPVRPARHGQCRAD